MNPDFINWLGELTLDSFGLLRLLAEEHNFFNWVIIAIIFILAVIWIKKMVDHNKEADESGLLK